MELPNLEKYKAEIHRTLISKLDLEKLSRVNTTQARQAVAGIVKEIIAEQRVPLNFEEQEQIQADLLDEVFGLGPLEPLLRDPKISDILVNNKDHVFIEKGGLLQRVDTTFRDDRHLLQIIDRIVSRVGRRVDESSPMVDARLQDGSRVNAIIPPLALDGPSLSIRRFGTGPLAANQLVQLKSVSPEMMEVLSSAVKARISILIAGGTGAGKTTFLNILSQYIPRNERLVTIEDAAELRLAQENIVRLETRPPNIEGKGAIRQRQLLVNCLRMRPDRIIMGEVRGEEAFDMLQAMNTGHEGSMTTIHANTPRDAISRLESMVAMSNMNMAEKSVRQQIASAITMEHVKSPASPRSQVWKRTSSACRRSLISAEKGLDPMVKSSAYFHRLIFAPDSSNGFASLALSCRRLCSSTKHWSTERRRQQIWYGSLV
jgi:pilus assembly protein CpaF